MVIKVYLKILKFVFDREWSFILNRRKYFLFILFAPVIIYGLIMSVFHNPVIRDIPIVLVNEDNSPVSRNLASKIDASPYVKISKSVTSIDEGRRLLSSAEIYGLVIIPEDFSKKVLGYKGADVFLYYNNELFLLGSLVNKGVLTAVQDLSNEYNKKYMMSKGVPAYSADFQVKPVKISDKTLFNPYLNYRYFFVLGLLAASFQLFVICFVIYGFVREEKNRTFYEVIFKANTAPLSFVTGKTLPYMILATFSSAYMLFLIFVYIGTPLNGSFAKILLGTLMYTFISVAAGVFIAVILRPLAFSAAAVYAAPTFAYAGITYPQIAMPKAAYLWSEFLPLTHYHRILVNEAVRGSAPYNSTNSDILYMFLLGLFVYIVAVAAVKFYSSKYSRGLRK